MCEACSAYNGQTIEISEGLFDVLLVSTTLSDSEIKEIAGQLHTQTTTPTFKPNLNLGEGVATDDEIDYRESVIKLLEPISEEFKSFNKSTIFTPEQQISRVDKLIDTFISEAQAIVQKRVTERYQSGYKDMNNHLISAKVKPPVQNPLQPRLQSLLRQQLQNIEDIGLVLRGRLRQIINIRDVRSYYKQEKPDLKQYLEDSEGEYYIDPKTKKKVYIDNWDDDTDTAMAPAQNNTDMLCLFGWIEGYNSGFLEAGMYASAALTSALALTIDIPWETAGDDNVCEECDLLASEGPYSIWDWPATPHFGCRCGPGDPVISFT